MSKPIKKTDQGKPWATNRSRRSDRPNRDQRKFFLAVCEDTESSVYYLKAFKKSLLPKTLTLEVAGVGLAQQKLIDEVPNVLEKVRRQSGHNYFDEIWVFFDFDNAHKDTFDNAITSGEKRKYHVAWSNECFELWYLLHFVSVDQRTSLPRGTIYRELGPYVDIDDYEKNGKGKAAKDIHERMAASTFWQTAMARARALAMNWDSQKPPVAPHDRNPCTMVFKFFDALRPYLAVSSK